MNMYQVRARYLHRGLSITAYDYFKERTSSDALTTALGIFKKDVPEPNVFMSATVRFVRNCEREDQ